jgi:hypothetical protein
MQKYDPQALVMPPDAVEWQAIKDQVAIALRSGLLPQSITSVEQACVIALTAREMQIPMLLALQNAYVVHGRPTFKTELLLNLAFARIDGFTYDVLDQKEKSCTVRVSRKGQQPHEQTFNEDMAKRGQVLKNSVWGTWSEDMYRWAATRKALRAIGAGMGWVLAAVPDLPGEGEEPEAPKENGPASGAVVVDEAAATNALAGALGGPPEAPAPKPEKKPEPVRYDKMVKDVGDRIYAPAKLTARGEKETFTRFVNSLCEWAGSERRFESYQTVTSDEWEWLYGVVLRYEAEKKAAGKATVAVQSPKAGPPPAKRFEPEQEQEPAKEPSEDDLLNPEHLVKRCHQAEKAYQQHGQGRTFLVPGNGSVWFIDLNILEACGFSGSQDVFALGGASVALLRRGVEQAMVDLDARKGRPAA